MNSKLTSTALMTLAAFAGSSTFLFWVHKPVVKKCRKEYGFDQCKAEKLLTTIGAITYATSMGLLYKLPCLLPKGTQSFDAATLLIAAIPATIGTFEIGHTLFHCAIEILGGPTREKLQNMQNMQKEEIKKKEEIKNVKNSAVFSIAKATAVAIMAMMIAIPVALRSYHS